MSTHTIKVSGVPDELLRLLDERIRRRSAQGRSQYIRELIRKDVLGIDGRSLREIMAPVYAETRTMPDTDEDLYALFEEARTEVYAEKISKQTQS